MKTLKPEDIVKREEVVRLAVQLLCAPEGSEAKELVGGLDRRAVINSAIDLAGDIIWAAAYSLGEVDEEEDG